MKKIQTVMASRTPETDHDVGELGLILDEIEREQIPERLLDLARRLQAALAARRLAGDRDQH